MTVSLIRHTSITGPGSGAPGAWLVLQRSRPRAPSAEPIRSMSIRLVRRDCHRVGAFRPFGPSCTRAPLPRRRMARDPVRIARLQLRWTSCLVGPCGLPRTRRQDASTLLLQPTPVRSNRAFVRTNLDREVRVRPQSRAPRCRWHLCDGPLRWSHSGRKLRFSTHVDPGSAPSGNR
jgi:hypothetical protein